ncbi:MAG: hypothetical protein WAN11_11680 [Syntrophobacteraceae bacterium]
MKRKIALLAILAITLTFMGAGFAEAVTSTAPVTLSATIASSATLTLNKTTVTFAGGELPPTAMAATENGAIVTATFRTATLTPGTLTVLAAGDLVDGAGDIIPITAVKSTGVNTDGQTFFLAGPVTWSKTAGVTVGTGPSGTYAGTFSWALDNSWSYATGTYGATALYTLTAP